MAGSSRSVERGELAYLRRLKRRELLYGAVCGALLLVTFPLPIVGATVFLLAYNQGHVRPNWAAILLGLFASCITGGLAWLAGRESDRIGKQHAEFVPLRGQQSLDDSST